MGNSAKRYYLALAFLLVRGIIAPGNAAEAAETATPNLFSEALPEVGSLPRLHAAVVAHSS